MDHNKLQKILQEMGIPDYLICHLRNQYTDQKATEFKKHLYCFIDYAKAFHCVDHNKLWKILKEIGIPDHPPPASWDIYMQIKKPQLEPDMEQ